MKLVAIFHCWDDWYLLGYAIDNMRPLVDGIIIIGSTKSNYGEYSAIPDKFQTSELFIKEPKFTSPLNSETDKRNYGLEIARNQGYTHFINCDADEFYLPSEFLAIKRKFDSNNSLNGVVCPVIVYFKSPTLSIGRDITLVPHIHRLTHFTEHVFNRSYPHAWINGQIRIDPSRSLNINSGVEYTEEIELHHMSWIRPDFEKKIRNSTARANLERSTIRKDLALAKEGYFCEFYQKPLFRATVDFNIPEYNVHESICQPLAASDRTPPNNL